MNSNGGFGFTCFRVLRSVGSGGVCLPFGVIAGVEARLGLFGKGVTVLVVVDYFVRLMIKILHYLLI